MTHIAPLLVGILTSTLLSCTESSIFCSWTKVTSNEVHYTFLRQAASSLRLYHSAWSGEGAHLLGCSWSDDAAVIQNYFSVCQEAFSHHPDIRHFDLDSMFETEDVCVSLAHPQVAELMEPTGKRAARSVEGRDERSEVKTHQRVKRGFIVPGTLWCGSGNKAPSYADLGVFSDTDSCCREHDQCTHTILSFHSQFGVFNTNIFTMSHCNCDNKFRSCLKAANDSISDVVGYTFFNLLQMHCFEFSHRLQCTQRNWFGLCKETEMALYAEVYPPPLYESTNPTEVSMNSTGSIVNTTTPAGDVSDTHLFSITAAASTGPTPSTRSLSASITPVTSVTTSTDAHASERTAPERKHDVENALHTRNQTESAAANQLSCGIFKDFDECSNQILPQMKRYGLYNSEPRTMYHCNCTTRFFQTLAEQRQLTQVQTLLLGHVSQSCFLPQDCTAGNTCTAVVVKTKLPLLDQQSGAVEEQHHLQAVKLKVRRPNTRRAKRKGRAVSLHKLCLRMERHKLKKSRKQNAVRGRKLV
ncbi:hypothetical protein PAMA_007497 [Pampus argenteus]